MRRVELIDGHPVVEQQIRFRLRTIVDERYSSQIRDGETMVWVVRALCKPPQYYPLAKEADERYRLAVQDVEAAAPLAGEARASALAYIDGAGDQLVLPFNGEDELEELRSHLSDIGELHEGERLVDAFRRLTPGSVVIEEPPRAEVPPERVEPRSDAEPPAPYVPPAIALPDSGDVEVVGSIYRRGRSELSDLIDSKFGES